MLDIVLLIVSIFLIIVGFLWLRRLKAAQGGGSAVGHGESAATQGGAAATQNDDAAAAEAKRLRRNRILAMLTAAVGGFLFITRLLDMVFGTSQADLGHISIWPERVDLFGLNIGVTVIYSWIAMAVLIIAAAVIRLTAFRNPKDIPTGAQNVIETIVDEVAKYTNAQAHGTGEILCSYVLSVGSFLVMCAALELFRLRAPTSDIAVTFALAFMTFAIINVYGIKRKGVLGRIKSLASPTPLVFPFRIISELAVPISLACRLFGNMLGGLIVVDLLYAALGNNAVGIPGVLGLYFNAFHPLIQTFIFVTLTLTFINEAIET